METGGASAIKIILWILAANAIVILVAWGLVAWWRKQARATINTISERIHSIASQMDQLAKFLFAYKNIDQEPFFTHLDQLQQEATELENRVQSFLDTSRTLEEEIITPPANQLQGIINAPANWFRRWRQSAALRRELAEIDRQMASTEQRIQTIYELPWELAAECRQASKEVAELLQAVQWLQANGARGTNFQKVASQGPLIQQSLDSIPRAFLEAPKDDLLAATRQAEAIRVFETLSSLRPALNRYLPQVREWRADLEKASAGYAGLKQLGASLRQTLASPPPGLLIAPLQERLDHVAQVAAEINQNLAQPDVDMLKSLVRETGQLQKVLQDTESQFSRAIQQVDGLRRDLKVLKDGLDRLSAQAAALEHSQRFPLAWDESAAALNELRHKLQSFGPPQQLRTPEQVVQQSTQVETLRSSYSSLDAKITQVASQHNSLLAFLDQVELREGDAWIKPAREILTQAAAYDPKNWPKKEIPQDLLSELDGLEQLQKRLAPADRTAPVNESSISKRVEETGQLAALHKDLRPRVESARTHLENLRALENQGKDQLTGAWSALEKVALLAESSTLLEEIVGADIDRMGEEIRLLANELNNHGQGEIEKKAQRIQALSERNQQILSQWIARLNTAAAEQARHIHERLLQLDAITRLDEPVVEDARALLQREEMRSLRGLQPEAAPSSPQNLVSRVATRITRTDSRPQLNDLEALAELKRKNDFWQMLAASKLALEEKTAPLLAAHQELIQARGEAVNRLGEVGKHFLNKRSWPPNNQAVLPENKALRPIDEKWEALKKKASRTEWTILEMGRLVQQYRLLSERAGQVLNRIQQDQERIQELEWQVDALKQRWMSQSDPGNPILRESIQTLLRQADSKLAYIKQQYTRGILSYDQSIQNLHLLYDELFSAQVSAGENVKIGLSDSRRGAD